MKKLLAVIALAIAAGLGYLQFDSRSSEERASASEERASAAGDSVLARAFENRTSDIQVEGEGIVAKILADDNEGSRHQRFVVRLASGQTVLVAHNIDLAPRISSLREGDPVSFHGEYEWNSKGGVIHWTHHDPAGRHRAGWIKHNGKTFQ